MTTNRRAIDVLNLKVDADNNLFFIKKTPTGEVTLQGQDAIDHTAILYSRSPNENRRQAAIEAAFMLTEALRLNVKNDFNTVFLYSDEPTLDQSPQVAKPAPASKQTQSPSFDDLDALIADVEKKDAADVAPTPARSTSSSTTKDKTKDQPNDVDDLMADLQKPQAIPDNLRPKAHKAPASPTKAQTSATADITKKLNSSSKLQKAKDYIAPKFQGLKNSAGTQAEAAWDKLKETKDKVLKNTDSALESTKRKLTEARKTISSTVSERRGNNTKNRRPK